MLPPPPWYIVSSWNSYSFISLGVFQGNIRRVCTSFNISKTIAVFVRICNQSSSTTSWYVCVCMYSMHIKYFKYSFFMVLCLSSNPRACSVFSILLEFQFCLTKFVIAFFNCRTIYLGDGLEKHNPFSTFCQSSRETLLS